MINAEQKKKYVKNKGTNCPICGSSDLKTGHPETFEDVVTIDVTCEGCGEVKTTFKMDHGLPIGFHCTRCLKEMVGKCRSRSW